LESAFKSLERTWTKTVWVVCFAGPANHRSAAFTEPRPSYFVVFGAFALRRAVVAAVSHLLVSVLIGCF
jgi:hypothetical protein